MPFHSLCLSHKNFTQSLRQKKKKNFFSVTTQVYNQIVIFIHNRIVLRSSFVSIYEKLINWVKSVFIWYLLSTRFVVLNIFKFFPIKKWFTLISNVFSIKSQHFFWWVTSSSSNNFLLRDSSIETLLFLALGIRLKNILLKIWNIDYKSEENKIMSEIKLFRYLLSFVWMCARNEWRKLETLRTVLKLSMH